MEAEVLERIGSRRKPPEHAELPPAHRVPAGGQLRPGDAGGAAVRAQPAADHACARCTSSSTPRRPTSCGRSGCARDRGIVLDFIDCPDRRLPGPPPSWSAREAAVPGTHVTAVLPRRSYSPLLGRLLHDRTADKIAAVVSQIPHARPRSSRSTCAAGSRSCTSGSSSVSAQRPPGRPARPGGPRSGHRRCRRRRARRRRARRGHRAGHGGQPAGRARGDPRHRRHGRGRGTAPVLAEPPPSPLRNLLRRRRPQPGGEPPRCRPTGTPGQDIAALQPADTARRA